MLLPFIQTAHACYLPALPFLQASLGGSSVPVQHPLSGVPRGSTSDCCMLLSRWSSSETPGSPATPSFLESLAARWPPFGRARADVAPPAAHQPEPVLTGGVTGVKQNHAALFLTHPTPGTFALKGGNAAGLKHFYSLIFVCWLTTDDSVSLVGESSVDLEIVWVTKELWFWRAHAEPVGVCPSQSAAWSLRWMQKLLDPAGALQTCLGSTLPSH